MPNHSFCKNSANVEPVGFTLLNISFAIQPLSKEHIPYYLVDIKEKPNGIWLLFSLWQRNDNTTLQRNHDDRCK